MLRINNIFIRKNLSDSEIFELAVKKHSIKKEDILDWHISHKSIDARRKNDVHYVYSIDIQVKNETKYRKLEKVKKVEIPSCKITKTLPNRPIIIGAGPAGLFAALTLVQHNVQPIILEQGQSVKERKITVENFLKTGKLNSLSNVQFGEGGSGTFSDGKLTTGISSPFCRKVLEEFVYFGAPKQILYLSKPHIGTDNLINIIENIRNYIISKGGTFLFNTKMIDIEISNNAITGVLTVSNDLEETIPTNNVILAIGHSSRETFEMLYRKGIFMEPKNFSVGVRIEHLQEWLNKTQYGTITKLKLPPADYKLAYHSESGRSCYTFCMCPRWNCYGFFK